MADYKDIVGTAVRNNAGNLSDDQKDQIFYDSTNVDFKYRIAAVTSAGAWRAGNSMNTAGHTIGGAGTATAGLAFAGYSPPIGNLARNESWNGSAWTEVADLANKLIASGSAGVNGLSAAAISGYNGSANVANVEDWTVPESISNLTITD